MLLASVALRAASLLPRAAPPRLAVRVARRRSAMSLSPLAAPPSAISEGGWASLGTPPDELRLDVTLPTGQSFRWRRGGPGEYSGVVAGRVFALRQTDSDVLYRTLPLRPAPGIAAAQAVPPAPSHALDDVAALRDYFALDVALAPLHAHFSAVDPARFAALAPFVRGARVLRQPPDECLFAFICSSNNHVSRIEGMVHRLCAAYGTCLGVHEASAEPYYAFPTPEQLAGASEEQLRALGFGYRAKFIVGSAAALAAKPGGACAWLLSLRSADVTASACCAALRSLPGVGPKVAACAALFSLEKHDLVPVDTHVWQLAQAHYAHALPPEALAPPKAANEANESVPDAEFDVAADPMSSPGGTAASGATPGGGSGAKKKKSGSGDGFTLRRGAAVEAALARLFGPYAGWAQTALFVAELRQQKAQLPEHLRTPATGGGTPGTASAQRKKTTPKAETQADGAKKRAPKRKLESGEAA